MLSILFGPVSDWIVEFWTPVGYLIDLLFSGVAGGEMITHPSPYSHGWIFFHFSVIIFGKKYFAFGEDFEVMGKKVNWENKNNKNTLEFGKITISILECIKYVALIILQNSCHLVFWRSSTSLECNLWVQKKGENMRKVLIKALHGSIGGKFGFSRRMFTPATFSHPF